MPFNGSGNFSIPNTFVYDTVIDEVAVNANFSDVAAGLSTCLTTNGQSIVAANIPMAGYRFTNVGAAVNATDYARADQIQSNALTYFTASGTNTYAISPSPAITAYAAGQSFLVKFTNANSGAATLNINGLGAKSILDRNKAALVSGAIPAGSVIQCDYDGTQFVITPADIIYSGGTQTITGNKNASGTFTFSNVSGVTTDTITELTSAAGVTIDGVLLKDNAVNALAMTLTDTDAGSNAGPTLTLFRDSASPNASDVMGLISYNGRDSGASSQVYGQIRCDLISTTASSERGQLLFLTTFLGTTATRAFLEAGFVVGSPTGGDKGVGTINATAVYDDNVLLTCYVLDAWNNNWNFNATDWDVYAPDIEIPESYTHVLTDLVDKDGEPLYRKEITEAVTIPRQHFGAHKFSARISPDHPDYVPEYDPKTLAGQIKHVMDKGHLTPFPKRDGFNPVKDAHSAGEMIQRLIEWADLSFVYMAELQKEITQLKTQLEMNNA